MEENKDRLSILELIRKATNIESVGSVSNDQVEGEIPAYTLQELNCEEWNKLAVESNIKSFKAQFEREPINYKEVEAWINLVLAEIISREVEHGE